MSTGIGPDGYPAVFDGSGWLSHDGRYRWNGVDWVPIAQPSQAGPWLRRAGAALLIIAAVGYSVYTIGADQTEYTAGFIVGTLAYFGVLYLIYRVVGDRWGCVGSGIRAVTVGLAILRVIGLIRLAMLH